MCGRKWVPEGLLATIEPPARLLTRGEGVLIEVGREGEREGRTATAVIGMHGRHKALSTRNFLHLPSPPSLPPSLPLLPQARVCRPRARGTGEADALQVSQALPFLEYDLHRQLMLKMRVMGVNACFAMRSQIQVRLECPPSLPPSLPSSLAGHATQFSPSLPPSLPPFLR